MARRGYPPAFRQQVLDLVASGRKVIDVAREVGISAQSIYTWRHQERIDRADEPVLNSTERADLAAAKRRITELETELAIYREAAGILKEHEEVARPQSSIAHLSRSCDVKHRERESTALDQSGRGRPHDRVIR
jgi:transposase